MHPKLDQYLEAEVMNADPVKLVALLYRGALSAAGAARAAFAAGDAVGRAKNVSKAWAIVNELRQSLDHKQGGEISARLSELYEYAGQRLLAANAEQSEKALDEAAAILTTLAEAWQQVQPPANVPPRDHNYAVAVDYQPLSIAC